MYLNASGRERHSTRKRRRAESAALAESASAIAIRGIGGNLEFAEAEILVRTLASVPTDHGIRWIVIDLHRVTRIQPGASAILHELMTDVLDRGVTLAVVDPSEQLDDGLDAERFKSLDAALEWCEDRLLGELHPELGVDGPVPLAEHDVIASIEPSAQAAIVDAISTRELATGDGVLGNASELVALVLSGRLGTYATATAARTGSLGPGTAISQVRLVNGSAGRETLRAEAPSTVGILSADRLAAAEAARSGVTGRLWASLTRLAAETDS